MTDWLKQWQLSGALSKLESKLNTVDMSAGAQFEICKNTKSKLQHWSDTAVLQEKGKL